MATLPITPDPDEAKRFLALLDPSGVFTFQTIDDTGQKRGDLTHIFHGTLDEHFPALCALNAAGAGIFVMVNEGDLKGRKAENVTRVRAHFVDLDGAPIDPILQAPDKPHMIVESSPNKWHAYWLIGDCPPANFKAGQQALADKYGGDKSVVDLPRVMRIPGFYHQKTAEPFMTRLEEGRED